MANILKQLDGVFAVGLRNNVPTTWLTEDSGLLRGAIKAIAAFYGFSMDIDATRVTGTG